MDVNSHLHCVADINVLLQSYLHDIVRETILFIFCYILIIFKKMF
jgi:hypothetical protein